MFLLFFSTWWSLVWRRYLGKKILRNRCERAKCIFSIFSAVRFTLRRCLDYARAKGDPAKATEYEKWFELRNSTWRFSLWELYDAHFLIESLEFRRLLFAACCLLFAVCCLLFVVCCVVCGVWCVLFVVCCLSFVCLLSSCCFHLFSFEGVDFFQFYIISISSPQTLVAITCRPSFVWFCVFLNRTKKWRMIWDGKPAQDYCLLSTGILINRHLPGFLCRGASQTI